MGYFEVLSVSDSKWDDVLERMPEADIFLTRPYAISQKTPGREPYLAVYSSSPSEGIIAKPFLLRREQGYCDIASLPGYGGAIFSGTGPGSRAFKQFQRHFNDMTRREGAISEVCVHNPFWKTVIESLPTISNIFCKRVAYVMTTEANEAMLSAMRADKRQNIKRSIRLGYHAGPMTPAVSASDIFSDLYSMTMDRVGASPRWRLMRDQIAALATIPGAIFFACFNSSEIETMSLILVRGPVAYYHLTANRLSKPRTGANDLLVFEVMKWCRANKVQILHLGGGASSSINDPLLHYKVGFYPAAEPPLHAITTYRMFDAERCSLLNEVARSRIGKEKFDAMTFEPAYRREEAA